MTADLKGVVVFDLDDTLYLERDYVRSGFAAAGDWFLRETGIAGLAPEAWRLFEAGRRGVIFDDALRAVGVAPAPGLVSQLVERYRGHWPAIGLAPDAADWLSRPPAGWATALITDGPAASQSRKVEALALASLGVSPIVLTDSLGPGHGKPDVRSFEMVQAEHGMAAAQCVYVADNAAKDFAGPRRLGWRTVQIRRAGGLYAAAAVDAAHAPDAVVATLRDLGPYLPTVGRPFATDRAPEQGPG